MDSQNAHAYTVTLKVQIQFVVASNREIHANRIHAGTVHRATFHEIQFASAQKVLSAIHSVNAIFHQSYLSCVAQARVDKMPIVMCRIIVNNASVVPVILAIHMLDVANRFDHHANQIRAVRMLNALLQQMARAYVAAQMA